MTRRRLFKAVAILTLMVLSLVTVGAVYILHTNENDAIATVSTWARLAPLPASAQNRQVDVKGSIFTREFVITFVASPAVVQQWIAAAPGPASAQQSVSGPVTTYTIAPGGGAEFAEVNVDSSSGRVIIRTYWS